MNEVQMKKYWFVRSDLLPLLKAIDRDILSAEYRIDGGDEYVEVEWLFDNEASYRRKINVTADSLLAIAKDILKNID